MKKLSFNKIKYWLDDSFVGHLGPCDFRNVTKQGRNRRIHSRILYLLYKVECHRIGQFLDG